MEAYGDTIHLSMEADLPGDTAAPYPVPQP